MQSADQAVLAFLTPRVPPNGDPQQGTPLSAPREMDMAQMEREFCLILQEQATRGSSVVSGTITSSWSEPIPWRKHE